MKQRGMSAASGFAEEYGEAYGVVTPWGAGDAPSLSSLYSLGMVMFIITICFYTFLTFFHGGPIHFFSILIAASCLYTIVAYRRSPKRLHNTTTILVSLFWGALLGQIIYDNFSYYMFMYSNARTYYDVVPTMPGDSVSDGGRLLFAQESRVDIASSVGFAADDGMTYCVAPIRDLTDTVRIEYWAVGNDCCDWLGGFTCDSAGDAEARGGAVIINHVGLFGKSPHMEHFEAAIKKASATYDLVSAERPVYLRWVDNKALEGLSSGYKSISWIFLSIATVAYAVIFFFALKVRYKKPAKAGMDPP